MEAWKPCDLILTSRLKVRDRAQKPLFEHHEKYFPDISLPLLYRPKDTRRQNIMVTIPGHRPDQQELVLNDVVEIPLNYAREVLDGVGLGLGSWLCPHSPLEPRSHHRRPPKSLDHRRPRHGSTIGFHLLCHTVELAMSTRLCLL